MSAKRHHSPTPKHSDYDERSDFHRYRPSLPPIPDLRFEQSYLRSIQRFVTVRQDPQQTRRSIHGAKFRDDEGLQKSPAREVFDIQWTQVFWITLRDHIISPLLQGTVWAIAGFYLSPVAAQLRYQVGDYTRSLFPSQEGSGVTWLRSWAGSLGFGAPTVKPPMSRRI